MANRGEVWLVDLGLAAKTRSALILNKPFGEGDRALITVIPYTSSLRGSKFEISLPVPFLKPGAFLVQNPLTIPAVKAERFLGRLSPAQLALVEAACAIGLGFEMGRIASGKTVSQIPRELP